MLRHWREQKNAPKLAASYEKLAAGYKLARASYKQYKATAKQLQNFILAVLIIHV